MDWKINGIGYVHMTGLGGLRHTMDRFYKYRMDKFVISRLCRLYADIGLQEQFGTVDHYGQGKGDCHYVRRGSSLALSQVAYR